MTIDRRTSVAAPAPDVPVQPSGESTYYVDIASSQEARSAVLQALRTLGDSMDDGFAVRVSVWGVGGHAWVSDIIGFTVACSAPLQAVALQQLIDVVRPLIASGVAVRLRHPLPPGMPLNGSYGPYTIID